MKKQINTKMDIIIGNNYFFDHVCPDDFDYRPFKNVYVERFKNNGFLVSKMYQEFYSRVNGIASDDYLSMDVYYYYIIPALNRFDFKNAYLDKNIYSRLFHEIPQPRTVIKNMNGRFFDSNENEVSETEAISLVCAQSSEMIIKPTVETCNGNGVIGIYNRSQNVVAKIFMDYGYNFIVQEKVRQHEKLARFNESSVNTMRIFTYRSCKGDYVHLNTFFRFGSKGMCKDNLSTGGGYNSRKSRWQYAG